MGSSEVASNSLPATDLSDEAGLELDNTSGIGNQISIGPSGTWTTVVTIQVSAPGSGYVTCIGAGVCDFDTSVLDGDCLLGWDRSSATNVAADSYMQVGADAAGDGDTRLGMTAIHTYAVSTGTNSFYLKATTNQSNTTSFDLVYHGATCMFFPTRY